MTTRRLLSSAVLWLGLVVRPLGAQAVDPALEQGRRQVEQGDYRGAIATLSGVVRRLEGVTGREKLTAEAYLQLGLAYAGLDQASPAVSQFYQALVRDPAIRLDPVAPPRAKALFAEALAQTQVETAKPKASGGKGKLIGIVAGVVAVGGVGLAVAGSSESSGPGPGSAPTISNLLLHALVPLNGGVFSVPIEFDFADPDADISSVAVRAPDAPAINPLPEAAGRKTGHILINQPIQAPPPGPLSVSVSVNDVSGHISNVLTGTTNRP